MIFKRSSKNALFCTVLVTVFSHQIATEVDMPELRLLSSQLKYEECMKLVAFHTPVSKERTKKSIREQECFQRLVKWICQLRTLTRNTYPVLVDRLRDIGRKDLIVQLANFHIKSSVPPKVIREVQTPDDSVEYEETSEGTRENEKEKNSKQSETNANNIKSSSNRTNEKFNEYKSVRVSLKACGILLLTTIILTCCCTLFVRNKLAKLCNKFRRKGRKSKFTPVDTDDERDVRRRLTVKKSQKKRKRAPSYERVHTATQNSVPVAPREPEESEPTGCYKCYRKKRKKSGKRPKR